MKKLLIPLFIHICILVLTTPPSEARDKTARYPVIPYPKRVIPVSGNFIIVPVTHISMSAKGVFTYDDAGVLKLENQITISNNGMRSPVEKSGQTAMQKSLHPYMLNFIEGGGYNLKLQYSFNGPALKEVPTSWFKRSSND